MDFKGATHRTVLEHMGILGAVRQARASRGGDGIVVDAQSRKVASMTQEASWRKDGLHLGRRMAQDP